MLWKNQSKGLMKVSSATGLILTLHPHGPASIEASIVNLAQDYTFSNNYPLIDKKGYFGERMENMAAASRYIECKLGKVADLILFDDMNQVEMVPNYDERSVEPSHLLPKLPIMLLNGAEGIGTGFSSMIPSFNHTDIIKSMISVVETGSPKKIKPWVRNFKNTIEERDGKFHYPAKFEEKSGKVFITELPKGYDGQKTNKYLIKWQEKDYLRDFIDSTVNNEVDIELIFKRGQTPALAEIQEKMGISTSVSPNYTLINERGIKIFDKPEEIITIFTNRRLAVVKKRYQLLAEETQNRLNQNNEIIRFIKDKHYAQAEKKANRKAFVDYLSSEKFHFAEYLADMAIYRMTKEEVEKRLALIKEDKTKLADYVKVAGSSKLVAEKLIEELKELDLNLTQVMKQKEDEKMRSSIKQKTKTTARKNQ
jgi:DNA gyrase subunit A